MFEKCGTCQYYVGLENEPLQKESFKVKNQELIWKLNQEHSLEIEEWTQLFTTYTTEDVKNATELAQKIAVSVFGKQIYFRGIIEFSNICKCDC